MYRPNRREGLKAVVAALAAATGETMNASLAGVMVAALVKWGIIGPRHAEEGAAALTEHDPFTAERREAMSESPLFREQIRIYSNEFTQGHPSRLEDTLSEEHGRCVTVGDTHRRSRIDYVRETLMEGVSEETLPQALRGELSVLWVGLPGQESQYDNSAMSERHGRIIARHLGQVTEDTRATYRYDEHEIRFLSTQVELMRRMVLDAYHIMHAQIGNELSLIKNTYFEGDETKFHREFLALALINSYQTGIGNMITVIKKFAHLEKRSLKRYDVFTGMALAAADGSFDPQYKEESSQYAFRVFAASLLINAHNTRAS